MKILHQMGFLKTAVVRSDSPCATIRRVVFAHLQPEMEGMGHEPRQPTPWPTRQLSNALFDIPFCPTTWPSCSGQHRINFGLPLNDIATLFHPERFPLCTTLDGLVLPTSTQSAVSAICCSSDVSFDSLDCLVIFTDGSSMSAQRHRPPLQADESGQGDTWAFLVLGERYGDPHSELFLIGWQAQPVIYDPAGRPFLGTECLGSEAAEREALTWALLWRIAQNHRIPTCFCTDSNVTRAQAAGEMGAALLSDPFKCLRGAAQALAAMLPGDCLRLTHVRGHSGDPFNDFVDYAAKQEREKSFYLPRPTFNMNHLRKFVPHLWTLFHGEAGLPILCQDGFSAPPPALPRLSAPDDAQIPQPRWALCQRSLSFATANVQSLYMQVLMAMAAKWLSYDRK